MITGTIDETSINYTRHESNLTASLGGCFNEIKTMQACQSLTDAKNGISPCQFVISLHSIPKSLADSAGKGVTVMPIVAS